MKYVLFSLRRHLFLTGSGRRKRLLPIVVNDFLPKSEKYLFSGRWKLSRMADFLGNFRKKVAAYHPTITVVFLTK